MNTWSVEPFVVDAPIDDVDLAQAAGCAHEHVVIVDHQVTALDQLHAHLLGQVEVLVVGGVVDARRQQHHRRVVDALRREPTKVTQQLVNVALDRPYRVAGEEVRQNALHDVAVGLDIGGP